MHKKIMEIIWKVMKKEKTIDEYIRWWQIIVRFSAKLI